MEFSLRSFLLFARGGRMALNQSAPLSASELLLILDEFCLYDRAGSGLGELLVQRSRPISTQYLLALHTMDSIYFLDGSYNPFAQISASSFAYESGFFEYDQMDTLFSDTSLLGSVYNNGHVGQNPDTCGPVDITEAQVDFSEFLRDGWSETAVVPTGRSEVLIAPEAPVPAQLMTPPNSAVQIPLLVPSTPKRTFIKTTAGGVLNTGLFSPPPSDRPVRTRRHNAYDEICQLSSMKLNTPRSRKPVIKSAPVFATPLLPASRAPETPVTPVARRDIEIRCSSPLSSRYTSSSCSSSDTFSPVDSPSSTMSDSFVSPLSPPATPVRHPTRRSGVDRPRLSRRGSGEKSYFHPYGDPTPSGERERPHGCRHPGNIVPGDVPCFKNFARMHDWVRHQRVHTGQTPYECLNCGKAFKRSDARGRHWDGKSNCEAYHMNAIREQLLLGQIPIEHPDIPILRRRAQKTEYRKESERTGVPIQHLKATTPHVKHEHIEGPGF
ncbi:hypothetical protein OPQ81_007175 [Rhizoctonia solani]|nr:hypothetical protein OPQ81_007175 [Rhizoctonia solani]